MIEFAEADEAGDADDPQKGQWCARVAGEHKQAERAAATQRREHVSPPNREVPQQEGRRGDECDRPRTGVHDPQYRQAGKQRHDVRRELTRIH
jgi:hypothetical protein